MSTQTKEQIQEIYEQILSLVKQGKNMEVVERFYADDISMQENENPPTVGKDANRLREQDFHNKLEKFNEMTLLAVSYGSDLAMAEWYMDFEHKEMGHIKGRQVSVTRFKDGKICDERFYYPSGWENQ